jgi:hypothetical protein
MSWFHRGVIGFFGFTSLLWLGQLISSTLSLCRTSPALASPLFLIEISTSRYHAPFLFVLFVSWGLMSVAEARVRKTPPKAYLQHNLHGVLAMMVWLAFPFYKALYLILWGLFASFQRRKHQWALPVLFTLTLVLNPQFALACQSPPMPSTALNMQELKRMLVTYRVNQGHYPTDWQELKQTGTAAKPYFKQLKNPYHPDAPAVINYASLSASQKARSPELSAVHRHTDIAGFRFYHQWWKKPASLPRDQGVVVYHYQSPQNYRLYKLADTGKLITLP